MCHGKQAQAEKNRNFKTYRKNNKELNTPIEKKFKSQSRTRKGLRQKKSSNIFRKCRFLMTRNKRAFTA